MAAASEADLAAKLLERLLADPAFRARFRRDPAAACREAGLDSLAAGDVGRRRQGDAHARRARVQVEPRGRDDGRRHGGRGDLPVHREHPPPPRGDPGPDRRRALARRPAGGAEHPRQAAAQGRRRGAGDAASGSRRRSPGPRRASRPAAAAPAAAPPAARGRGRAAAGGARRGRRRAAKRRAAARTAAAADAADEEAGEDRGAEGRGEDRRGELARGRAQARPGGGRGTRSTSAPPVCPQSSDLPKATRPAVRGRAAGEAAGGHADPAARGRRPAGDAGPAGSAGCGDPAAGGGGARGRGPAPEGAAAAAPTPPPEAAGADAAAKAGSRKRRAAARRGAGRAARQGRGGGRGRAAGAAADALPAAGAPSNALPSADARAPPSNALPTADGAPPSNALPTEAAPTSTRRSRAATKAKAAADAATARKRSGAAVDVRAASKRRPIDPSEFGAEGKGGEPSPEALALLKNKNVVLDDVGVKDIKARPHRPARRRGADQAQPGAQDHGLVHVLGPLQVHLRRLGLQPLRRPRPGHRGDRRRDRRPGQPARARGGLRALDS